MKGFGPGFSSARGTTSYDLYTCRHQMLGTKHDRDGPRKGKLKLLLVSACSGMINHTVKDWFMEHQTKD